MSGIQEQDFIYGLIRLQQPKTVIEVGVSGGNMAKSILKAIEDTYRDFGIEGSYTGYDVWKDHGLLRNFDGVGTKQSVSTILAEIGTHYNLVEIDTQADSLNFVGDLQNRFVNGIDFAFIDGDHSYHGIANDFFNVWPYLSPNAIVAFHDTAIIDGCREFMTDLRLHNNGSYDVTDFPFGWTPRDCGITLITKPGFGKVKIDESCGSIGTIEQIYNKEKQLALEITSLDEWWTKNINLYTRQLPEQKLNDLI